MHRIALPDNAAGVLAAFDCLDMGREERTDFACAVSGDKSDLADFFGGVEGSEQSEEVGGGGCRTYLDTNGIGNAAEIFDVSTIDLPCSISDPEEVCGGVVVGLAVICSVST